MFRQGESKPIAMEHSIIAKNPFDVPVSIYSRFCLI
jgi:hypothetical protein